MHSTDPWQYGLVGVALMMVGAALHVALKAIGLKLSGSPKDNPAIPVISANTAALIDHGRELKAHREVMVDLGKKTDLCGRLMEAHNAKLDSHVEKMIDASHHLDMRWQAIDLKLAGMS